MNSTLGSIVRLAMFSITYMEFTHFLVFHDWLTWDMFSSKNIRLKEKKHSPNHQWWSVTYVSFDKCIHLKTVIWTSSIGEQKFSGTCSYSRSIPSYSQLSQGSNPILVHLQAPHHSQTWLTEEEKYSRNSWKYFKIQHLMRDSWKYFFLPAIQYTLLIHDWQGTNTWRKILVSEILKNHKVLVQALPRIGSNVRNNWSLKKQNWTNQIVGQW